MVRFRQERESAALADMQAALGRVAEADEQVRLADQALAAGEAARTEGERAIYDRLGASAALTPPQLEEQLGALARLTDAVDAACDGIARARARLVEAHETLSEMRERYARSARDAAKWVRIETMAADVRRRDGEALEELELEDETSLRHGRLDGSGA